MGYALKSKIRTHGLENRVRDMEILENNLYSITPQHTTKIEHSHEHCSIPVISKNKATHGYNHYFLLVFPATRLRKVEILMLSTNLCPQTLQT